MGHAEKGQPRRQVTDAGFPHAHDYPTGTVFLSLTGGIVPSSPHPCRSRRRMGPRGMGRRTTLKTQAPCGGSEQPLGGRSSTKAPAVGDDSPCRSFDATKAPDSVKYSPLERFGVSYDSCGRYAMPNQSFFDGNCITKAHARASGAFLMFDSICNPSLHLAQTLSETGECPNAFALQRSEHHHGHDDVDQHRADDIDNVRYALVPRCKIAVPEATENNAAKEQVHERDGSRGRRALAVCPEEGRIERCRIPNADSGEYQRNRKGQDRCVIGEGRRQLDQSIAHPACQEAADAGRDAGLPVRKHARRRERRTASWAPLRIPMDHSSACRAGFCAHAFLLDARGMQLVAARASLFRQSSKNSFSALHYFRAGGTILETWLSKEPSTVPSAK